MQGNHHGSIVKVDVSGFDETVGKYDCFLTFQDGFEYSCLLTKQDILTLQQDIQSRINVAQEKDTLRKFSPLPRQNLPVLEHQQWQQQQWQQQRQREQEQQPYSLATVARQEKRPSSEKDLRDARENINSGKSLGYRMSLKEYAEMNPQRTKLLNGKLFTPELIRKTQSGGIPEALQD